MNHVRRHGEWWQKWTSAEGRPGAVEPSGFDGHFVRYFEPNRDVAPESAYSELAAAMTAAPDDPPTPEGTPDAEENRGTADAPGVPAAYTYFGQFIDHDLTLDPVSGLHGSPLTGKQVRDLVDFRTPRLDLDCLYGRGPSDQPYLYEADGLHLVLGEPMSGNPHDAKSVDVPRASNGRAVIGDPRNDENRIVSQLHATMMRFHNAMTDRAVADAGSLDAVDLPAVQHRVRRHYQWAVVHDYLPTIIAADVYGRVFPSAGAAPVFTVPYLQQRYGELRKMPVEFSVGAYRYGHSMVRPSYRINETIARRQIFSSSTDRAGDLGGMRPIPDDWALDWQFFLDIEHHGPAPIQGDDPVVRTPQYAYKIDTSLVNPLAHLPAIIATNPNVLAERNLLRGRAFSLPTGETVAEALGVTALKPEEILLGKATADAADRGTTIADIAGGVFAGATPLWTYVLAEAWQTSWASHAEIANRRDVPVKLGPVGGHLVAETIAAFLDLDADSYLNLPGGFTPDADLLHDGRFGLAEIINTALR